MPESHLESLYQEAQAAIKARDYEYACELLKRILAVDEEYKDTSRLLARAVRLRKRRWYNDPRLWGALGAVGVFVLGFLIVPGIGNIFTIPTPANTTSPIVKFDFTKTPISVETQIPPPTATAIQSQPTQTPAWVNDFAEPILVAIQNRPPDFQDNFLKVSSGWHFYTEPPNRGGKMEISNGVLLMNMEGSAVGSATHTNMRFSNFVLQVDMFLIATKYYPVSLQFPHAEIGWRYTKEVGEENFSLDINGDYLLRSCEGGTCTTLVSGRETINWAYPVTITIIVRRTECAVFLNDIPGVYVNNLDQKVGKDIKLKLPGIYGGPVSLRYDNLIVWDLDKIPNLP